MSRASPDALTSRSWGSIAGSLLLLPLLSGCASRLPTPSALPFLAIFLLVLVVDALAQGMPRVRTLCAVLVVLSLAGCQPSGAPDFSTVPTWIGTGLQVLACAMLLLRSAPAPPRAPPPPAAELISRDEWAQLEARLRDMERALARVEGLLNVNFRDHRHE